MTRIYKHIAVLALIITVASIIVWRATGGDYYTKFEVVEQVEIKLDQDDPLVAAGFYDDQVKTETSRRDEFRLGLLPTPSKLLDKHLLSVASLTLPVWTLALVLFLLHRRKKSRAALSTVY